MRPTWNVELHGIDENAVLVRYSHANVSHHMEVINDKQAALKCLFAFLIHKLSVRKC